MESTALFNEIGRMFFHDQTTITDQTWKDLQSWNYSYEELILTNTEDKLNIIDKIISMDMQGYILLERIKKEWLTTDLIVYRSTILGEEVDLSGLVKDPLNKELYERKIDYYRQSINDTITHQMAYRAFKDNDFKKTFELLSNMENRLGEESRKMLEYCRRQL